MTMETQQEQIHLPSSLEQARIQRLPDAAFYIPNFISQEEEQAILSKVRCVTPTTLATLAPGSDADS